MLIRQDSTNFHCPLVVYTVLESFIQYHMHAGTGDVHSQYVYSSLLLEHLFILASALVLNRVLATLSVYWKIFVQMCPILTPWQQQQTGRKGKDALKKSDNMKGSYFVRFTPPSFQLFPFLSFSSVLCLYVVPSLLYPSGVSLLLLPLEERKVVASECIAFLIFFLC